MIIEQEKIVTQASSNFHTKIFQMKASPHAFKILSSSLYSKKIRSIIREITVNGVDALVAAGRSDVPTEVHLPNNLESYFAVKDTGTGISQDDMENLYITYFASSKTQDNTQTGTFGLGNKSFLQYVDQATLTSIFNGKKYTYSIYLNEDGVPAVSLLGVSDSNERNGFEVRFPVKPQDFAEFRYEAKEVFKDFRIKPLVTGASIEYDQEKLIFEGDCNGAHYRVLERNNGSRVVMGSVGYTLDFHQIPLNNRQAFNYYDIVVDVPIGSVDIVASREALENTLKTKSFLAKLLDHCTDRFAAQMEAELNKCETFLEACQFYSQNTLFLNGAEWKGKPVMQNIRLKEQCPCDTFSLTYGNKLRKYSTNSMYSFDARQHDKVCIIEDDTEKTYRARIKNLLSTNKDIEKVLLVGFTDDKHKQTFLDDLGLTANDIMKASSLPKAPRVKSATPKKASPKAFKFTYRGGVMDSWSEQVVLDISKGGVYVELEAWYASHFGTNTGMIKTLLDDLKKVDGKEVVLYGVRKPLSAKLAKQAGWIKLKDYAEGVYKANALDKSVLDNAVAYLDLHNFDGLHAVIADDDVQKLCKNINYVRKNSTKIESLKNIGMRHLGLSYVGGKIDELEIINQKYPLLVPTIKSSGYAGLVIHGAALREYVELKKASLLKKG